MLTGVRLRQGKWATVMVDLLFLAMCDFIAYWQVFGGHEQSTC